MTPTHHIALNAQLLSLSQGYRSAGISWYIANLLKELGPVAPDLRYTALLREPLAETPNLSRRVTRWPTHRPAVRIAWEQLVQPLLLHQTEADLLHAMAFVAPIISPCPFVVTVYDLSFLRYPQAFRPLNRAYLRHLTAYSVKRARRVIAISESTRQDVIQQLGKPAAQVRTVYCGADDSFQPMSKAAVAEFKRQQGLPNQFVLYLGTLEPRKNVAGLIRAYAAWHKRDSAAWPLFIAGGKGWYYEEIFALVESLGVTDAVHFPGYIPQTELTAWYNAADLFVYPSHFEGFGLPVLEAMACGTPVITSDVSSLPEVAGEAARLVPPSDPAALADTLAELAHSPDLRAELRPRGLAQAARFRWDKAARETAAVYREALSLKQ